MKKSTKALLFGVGAAAVGLLAYAAIEKHSKPVTEPGEPAHDDPPCESGTTSREYIDRRREVLRERADARSMPHEEISVDSVTGEVASNITTQNNAENAEKPVTIENTTESGTEPAVSATEQTAAVGEE